MKLLVRETRKSWRQDPDPYDEDGIQISKRDSVDNEPWSEPDCDFQLPTKQMPKSTTNTNNPIISTTNSELTAYRDEPSQQARIEEPERRKPSNSKTGQGKFEVLSKRDGISVTSRTSCEPPASRTPRNGVQLSRIKV